MVSGKFYPGTPTQLQKNCEALLGLDYRVPERTLPEPVGVVLPHAGYIYSGRTAAMGLRAVAEFGKPENVIILGPNHTGYGKPVSVWPRGEWYVPNGAVPINETLVERLISSGVVEPDFSAHEFEHSLEVQLPLLIAAFGTFQLVAVCMLDQRLSTARSIADVLKIALVEFPSTLVVASSDLNHYDPHEVTLRKDELALEKILQGDLQGLYEVLKRHNVTMCGPGPVAVARSIFSRAELVYHTTSAEFSQDYSYTVGYASILLRN